MRHSVWDTLVNAGHVYLPVKLERHVKARAASLCASKRRFFSNSSRIPHFKISDIYLSSPTHRLSLNIENLGRVEQSVQARQNQSSGRDIYKPINFCMQHTMRFAIPSTVADFFPRVLLNGMCGRVRSVINLPSLNLSGCSLWILQALRSSSRSRAMLLMSGRSYNSAKMRVRLV